MTESNWKRVIRVEVVDSMTAERAHSPETWVVLGDSSRELADECLDVLRMHLRRRVADQRMVEAIEALTAALDKPKEER